MKRNFWLLWFRDALVSAASAFASVSVLQALFLQIGMSTAQVSFYVSFTQAMYLAASLLFADATRHYRNTRRANVTLFLVQAFFLMMHLPLTLVSGIRPGTACLIAMILGALMYAVYALRLVFDYKQPCEVMDISEYSTYTSISGIFTGAGGMLTGFFLTFLYAHGDFFSVTSFAFIAAGACQAGAALFNRMLRPYSTPGTQETNNEIKKKGIVGILFRDREFRSLILPNLVRGIGAGVVSMLPTLAMRQAGFNEGNVSLITSFTYLSTFISCAVYAWAGKKHFPLPLFGVIGSVLFFFLCFSLSSSVSLFLAMYFPAYCGYNIVCYAIPDMVYKSVDPEIISAFHTWRMALTTLGTSAAAMAVGALAELIDGKWLILAGCISIFYCCISYFLYFKKYPLRSAAEDKNKSHKNGE